MTPLILRAGGLALLLGAAPAYAQASSSDFAREMLRVCVNTDGQPEAIRALAARESWASTDPLGLPVKNRVTVRGVKKQPDQIYQRTSAWTYSKDGLEIVVGLFDIPELPSATGRQCEIMAWNLNAEEVDQTVRADPRIRDESIPGLPMKTYSIAAPRKTINYVASDAGAKVLHAFTVR